MQSSLQQLYKTKFVLVSFIATVVGAAVMVAAGWPSWQAIAALIGGALFTVGVVLVAFQYVGNETADRLADERTNRAVSAAAPALVSSVIDSIANTPRQILDVTSPEVLDRVVENSLAKQLGDRTFAADVYRDLKAQVLRSPERWYDLRISAALTPWSGGKRTTHIPMFVATFRYDFRATHISPTMRFACVTDLDEYRELQADPGMTEVWYFQPKPGFDGSSPDIFELAEVVVDGHRQKIRRTSKAGAQYYSARLSTAADALSGETVVSFTYHGLLQQHGHLLHVDLAKPTKGLTMNLAYGDAGIRYVSVADYVAAAKQPMISRRPTTDPSPAVSLIFDGWVLRVGWPSHGPWRTSSGNGNRLD